MGVPPFPFAGHAPLLAGSIYIWKAAWKVQENDAIFPDPKHVRLRNGQSQIPGLLDSCAPGRFVYNIFTLKFRSKFHEQAHAPIGALVRILT